MHVCVWVRVCVCSQKKTLVTPSHVENPSHVERHFRLMMCPCYNHVGIPGLWKFGLRHVKCLSNDSSVLVRSVWELQLCKPSCWIGVRLILSAGHLSRGQRNLSNELHITFDPSLPDRCKNWIRNWVKLLCMFPEDVYKNSDLCKPPIWSLAKAWTCPQMLHLLDHWLFTKLCKELNEKIIFARDQFTSQGKLWQACAFIIILILLTNTWAGELLFPASLVEGLQYL